MANNQMIIKPSASYAKKNIDEFYYNTKEAIAEFRETIIYLFDELSNVWFSDNAVGFYNLFSNKIDNCCEELNNEMYKICQKAIKSYNNLASKYDANRISYGSYSLKSEWNYLNLTKLLPIKDDIVGINKSFVEDEIIPKFQIKMNKTINKTNIIPKYITLFNGGIPGEGILRLDTSFYLNKIRNICNDLLNDLKHHLQNEINIINNAKQESINNLSS